MFANSLVVNIQDRVPYGARMCIMRGEFAGRICITGDFEDNQRRVNAFLFDEERWVVVPTREFLPYDDDVRPPKCFIRKSWCLSLLVFMKGNTQELCG
jgi:hypothetical protein